jgi:hypothetical protein
MTRLTLQFQEQRNGDCLGIEYEADRANEEPATFPVLPVDGTQRSVAGTGIQNEEWASRTNPKWPACAHQLCSDYHGVFPRCEPTGRAQVLLLHFRR